MSSSESNKRKDRHKDKGSEGKAASAAAAGGPESQRQRWLKYGTNVAVAVVAAVAIALLVVYLADRHRGRVDTTADNLHSLKPQTVNVIRGLEKPVKLVSLYTQERDDAEDLDEDEAGRRQDYARVVSDLLDEYARKSNGNVTAEAIDPEAEPGRLQELFDEVANKYGNEVTLYKEVMAAFPETVETINTQAAKESERLREAWPAESLSGLPPELQEARFSVQVAVEGLRQELEDIERDVKREAGRKTPDYKRAAELMRSRLTIMSTNLEAVITQFRDLLQSSSSPEEEAAAEGEGEEGKGAKGKAKSKGKDKAAATAGGPEIPPDIRAYMEAAVPNLEKIKEAPDKLLERMAELGQLRQLEEVRQNKSNSIVVMAENDLKVLPFDKVWTPAPDVPGAGAAGEDEGAPKLRFAGEQQVSTAIVGLTSSRQRRVILVRGGGPPQALRLNLPPFLGLPRYTGPLASVVDRLREYNYEVLEKDLSGQWEGQAMQLHMQMEQMAQMGAMMGDEFAQQLDQARRGLADAGDEQMQDRDAVWVVTSAGQDQPGGFSVGAELKKHLDEGGRALVLAEPGMSPLTSALSSWGITLRTDAMAVHEELPPSPGQPGDIVAQAQREQVVFVFNDYGDAPFTEPLQTLDLLMYTISPVEVATEVPDGYEVKPLLPLPQSPRHWGETSFEQYFQEGDSMEFDPPAAEGEDEDAPVGGGDIPGPLYAGAWAERLTDEGGRLVVLGSVQFAHNNLLGLPDVEMARRGRMVARLPGNGELFVNAVFWLSGNDTMIAISPAAMEVERIRPISEGALTFWRVGVLLIGLPLAVLVAGSVVYFTRRD